MSFIKKNIMLINIQNRAQKQASASTTSTFIAIIYIKTLLIINNA